MPRMVCPGFIYVFLAIFAYILPAQAYNPQSHPPFQREGSKVVLYGQPVCVWEMQLIITNGQTDLNLASSTYGKLRVPHTIAGITGFHVQLFHHGAKFKARYSGREALRILEKKGYFRKIGNSWIAERKYDDFVRYGRQTAFNSNQCADFIPSDTSSTTPVSGKKCYSKDGRDALCRAHNCDIPEIRRALCFSNSGRHGTCRANGCLPAGECYWKSTVVRAYVPCYWK